MSNPDLSGAIERLVVLTKNLPDTLLDTPWAWRAYDSEGVRFAFFRILEELRALAVNLEMERQEKGPPIPSAQRILGQYHAAFRDLQAELIGVEEEFEDISPSAEEWSIRKALAHGIAADLGFYVVVRYALDRHRSVDGRPPEISKDAWDLISGIDEDDYRSLMDSTLARLKTFHGDLHERILSEFAGVSDAELELPSTYWEDEEMSLRFRLHRFESHLRQHTIQINKTLAKLGQSPNEARRLLVLIYSALAECEGKCIGAASVGEGMRGEVAESISKTVDEISSRLA